jgi:PKD repeat protein
MKKNIRLYLFSFAFLAFIANSFTSTAQIIVYLGTGTNTNTNTGYPAPYGQWYNNSRMQYIITPAELNSLGLTANCRITTIGFNNSSVSGVAAAPLVISLGHTTNTYYPNTSFIPLNTLTTVFSATSYQPITGWNIHNFSTNFYWNGTSSVVVDVYYGVVGMGYTYNALTYYTSTSNQTANGVWSDGTNIQNNATGSLSTARANMRIGYIPAGPMSITTVSSSTPSTSSVFQGQNFVKICSADIGTWGALNPFLVKRAYFSTNGTTSVTDIANARLFEYDNSPLIITDTFDKPVILPNGSFYFNIYDTLNGGTNHYILTYDVNSNAAIGNVLDATFDSILIADTMRYPTITNPTGNRTIVQYFSFTGYCTMGVNIPNSTSSTMIGVSKFVMSDLLGTILINNATADLDATSLYTTPNPTLYRQSRYPIQIKGGQGNGEQEVVWIDWNNDGAFDKTTEEVSFKTFAAAATAFDTITVPCTASVGYHRMRVVSDYSGASKPIPCNNLQYGDIEDYIFYVASDPIPNPTYARPQTAYTFSQTHFTNTTSTKGNIDYGWDFDNNGTIDQIAKNGVYTFTSAGKKIVTLKATVNGCDSTYSRYYKDTVTVVNPTRPPKTDFIASKNIVAVFDQVDINDLSEFGPSDWRWEVTPYFVNANQAYDFLNNTSSTTQNISLVFYEMGYYTVKLVTTNLIGSDSVIKTNYIYVAESVDMCSYASSDKVAGFLYDDGGKGVYAANHPLCSFLINPICNTSITLKFSAFDVNIYQTPGGDWLKVYDGKNNTGIPLHTQAGYPLGFQNKSGNVPFLPPDLTAYSGNMYIEWHTDGAFQADGFAASWTAQLLNVPKPTAGLTGPDTVFQKVPATFVDLSTGTDIIVKWDTNNDGFYIDAQDSIISRYWDTTGLFNIGIMAQSCAQYDTFDHPVLVIRPANKPTANFTSDFRRVPTNYPVKLTDLSVQTGTLYKWNWTITPSTYKVLDNKTVNNQNIRVSFSDTGYYTINLVGTNAVGSDDTTMTKYIYVYQTCKPDVSNLTSDVGFSDVIFEDNQNVTLFNNTSLIGTSAYTDYSSTYIASVYQGATYTITMKRNTTFNNITRTVWVDFNQDGDFTDAGEQVINDVNAATTSFTGSFTIPTNANTGFTAMRIAANAGILPNKSCGPNYTGEFEDYGLFIKVDDVAPVIELTDPVNMTINSCASYVEPGYKATDNVNGNITNKVVVTGNVFNTKIGAVHQIKYNVTDTKGNKAIEQVRTVNVLADIVKPTITLNGNTIDSILVLSVSTYTDPGYVAKDNCSGLKSISSSGTVNTKKLGTYDITYTASDSAGNIETVVRSVVIYDNINPTIKKIGNDTIYVNVKSPYVEPGVTVNDNYWKNLVVSYTGSVNTSKVGTYILSYCVSDSSGNGPVCTDRYVVVQDKVAPTVTLIGDTVILDVKRSFTDPGYYVTDNYWSSNYLIVSITGFVNINKIGDYLLTYVAKDASGNISTPRTRLVRVIDRIAPTISLLGPTFLSIPRWSTFEDPDVAVKDNYYTNAELQIEYNATGTFKNTQLPGLYSYTYSVCDPSNNCSEVITRLIFVEDGYSIKPALTDNNIKYYPNPANNILNIDLDIPKQTHVEISIYNNLGELVNTVFAGSVTKSSFKVDISNLSSGIYLIRFNINDDQVIYKKLLITK